MGARNRKNRYHPSVERMESRESTSGLSHVPGPGPTAAVVHTASLQTREYPFDKTIGVLDGYKQVGGLYTMSPGKFAQIVMTSSGG